MHRLLGVFAVASVLSLASVASAQNTPRDQEMRIRRAASSAENALAVHQCVHEATILRDVADAARAESRAVVRAALLESIDNRSRALASCRASTAPRRVQGRMLQVRGAESERGFGQMSLSPLLAQFTEREADFLTCYEEELEDHIGTSGQVTIEMTVHDRTGEIDTVRAVESTFVDHEVAECVERVVRGFRAMRPGPMGGDITYRFPIEFEPGA